jgi:hypothetical protein
MASWSLLALLSAFYGPTATGRAEPADGDGIYRRLDGDVILSAGVGGGFDTGLGAVYVADLRARYLDSAGWVVSPEWRPDGEGGVALAVDLRPIFLGKFLANRSLGRSWLDLTLDSLGFELGTWLGPLNRDLGAALLTGAGVDFPLGGSGGRGVWLRLGGRYHHAFAADRAAPAGGREEALLMATLYYRAAADFGLAGWEPRRYTVP